MLGLCAILYRPITLKSPKSLPAWHGWHAFRRGLATNLHTLRIDDKTIQAILRHSNIGITQNIYIKSVTDLQVSAMDSFSEKNRFEIAMALQPNSGTFRSLLYAMHAQCLPFEHASLYLVSQRVHITENDRTLLFVRTYDANLTSTKLTLRFSS